MNLVIERPATSPSGSAPVTGVRTGSRLQAVAEAELFGHLGDHGLDAVVATLHVACDVPIAVINAVTPDCQTYPAEIGVGASFTMVADQLSFCAQVVNGGSGLVVADATADPSILRTRSSWPEP